MTTGLDDFDSLVPTTKTIEGSGVGPLAGLTFAAKDLFDIKGHVSSFGHATWRDTHDASSSTAPTVSRTLDAGANLVGIAKMDQLAYSLIGNVGEGVPPRNALDESLFCGGSSSGSAAAVAGGLADFAFGTDTAGSVRVPAAACGLHSLRPSHHAIDPEGVIPLAPSFDVVGILARRASVIASVLGVVAPTLTSSRRVDAVRIATDIFETADPETARLGRVVAERVAEAAGVALVELEFGRFTSPDVGDLFARLQSREIWSTHADWIEAHRSDLARDVRGRLDRCKILSQDSPVAKTEDREERLRYRQDFSRAVLPGTVVILPVLPEHGPKRSWDDETLIGFRAGCFRLTAPSSFTGAPQAVLSVRSAQEDRSIGIGLLTAPGDDRLLLDLMTAVSDEAQGITV